jgi:alkanesulfonate monooxygenase SsuD/methylene tetrahydromethanopterin reductase-like flavin-dependent oxidoreductase (luciferase family)
VLVDVLLETFGTSWPEIREGALLAERSGLDGVWLNDHLAGSVQGASYVLECWTVLSALAADVPRVTLGPLVLNVANRDPGTLAVMAATLQHISGGRLLLGLGAGARAGTPFASEQEALGRQVGTAAQRRDSVEHTIARLRQVWSGAAPPAAGFLKPEPVPPIVVAGVGPKMAEVAGRVADGICLPASSPVAELVAVARRAYASSGRDPDRLLVTALASLPPGRLPSIGRDVDRVIVNVARPFSTEVVRLGDIVGEWRATTSRE